MPDTFFRTQIAQINTDSFCVFGDSRACRDPLSGHSFKQNGKNQARVGAKIREICVHLRPKRSEPASDLSGFLEPDRSENHLIVYFSHPWYSSWGNRGRGTVARPIAVEPTITVPLSCQQKCSDHTCTRGLNKGTFAPV